MTNSKAEDINKVSFASSTAHIQAPSSRLRFRKRIMTGVATLLAWWLFVVSVLAGLWDGNGGGGGNPAHAAAAASGWYGPEALFDGARPRVVVRPSDGDIFVIAETATSIIWSDSSGGYNPAVLFEDVTGNPVRVRAAFDNTNTLQVTWMSRSPTTGSYHVDYATISPRGAVSPTRNLTTELGHSRGAFGDIALSPTDGHLYVAMEFDGLVGVADSTDNGTTWGQLTTLGSADTPGVSNARVAVGGDGIVHMVYSTGPDIMAVDRNTNGVWSSQPTRLDNLGTPGGRAFWSGVAADSNSGDAYAVWQEDGPGGISGPSAISYARYDHTSHSWQSEIQNISHTLPTDGSSDLVPSVVVATPTSAGAGSGHSNSNSNSGSPNRNVVWVTWEAVNRGDGSGAAQSIYSTDQGQTFDPSHLLDITSADQHYYRGGPWSDATAGNGAVYWAGQLAGDDGSSYQVWLASTSAIGGGGPPGSLYPPAQGTATVRPVPTPTVPGWSRPNLHLYFKDAAAPSQSVSFGVKVTLLKLVRDPLTGTRGLQRLAASANTSGGESRVDFDATAFPSGLYFLELRRTDNDTLILPEDPTHPRSSGDLGNAEQLTAQVTPLELTKGSVIYVNTYFLAGGGGGTIVAVPLAEKHLVYYPPMNGVESDLGVVPTQTPGPSATPGIPPTYVGYGNGSFGTNAYTPAAGGGLIGGVDSANYGITPGSLPQRTASDYTPQPSPTTECRNGCISNQGGSANINRQGVIAVTAQAQTARAQMTAGVYQAGGDSGFRGAGSSSDVIATLPLFSNTSPAAVAASPTPLTPAVGNAVPRNGAGGGNNGNNSTSTGGDGGNKVKTSNNNDDGNNSSLPVVLIVLGGAAVLGFGVGPGLTALGAIKAKAAATTTGVVKLAAATSNPANTASSQAKVSSSISSSNTNSKEETEK